MTQRTSCGTGDNPALPLIQMRQNLTEEKRQILTSHGKGSRHARKLLAGTASPGRRHPGNAESYTSVIHDQAAQGSVNSLYKVSNLITGP